MPRPPIIDLRQIDLSRVIADKEHIRRLNPHRFEFEMLDAVVYADFDTGVFVGYHDVRADAWWTRGHIPGRPLFPGVLMIETAAQLASFMTHQILKDDRFVGFAGVDEAKFRDVVTPPCRFVVVGKCLQVKPRRIVCASQGFVGDTMVFEAEITGMPV